MCPESTVARPSGARSALWVAVITGIVAVLGAAATGRMAFALGVAISAAMAFGTLTVAASKGRDALAAGEPVKAGALAGLLLAVRFIGLATLMVLATVVPSLLDMWGVVAGMVAADATLMASEGLMTLTVA